MSETQWREKADEAQALMDRVRGITDGSIEVSEDEVANIPKMLEDVKALQAKAVQLQEIDKVASDIAGFVKDNQDPDVLEQPDVEIENIKGPFSSFQEKTDEPEVKGFRDMGEWLHACWLANHPEPRMRKVDPRLFIYDEHGKQGKEIKQMVENVGASGGFLVPVEFRAQLQAVAGEMSLVRPRATIIRMRRRQMNIPVLDQTNTTAGTPAWYGGMTATWTEEATQKALTTPAFRQVELVAHKLIMYTRSSDELLEDSAISLSDFLTGPFGFAGGVAWYEDWAFIRGTGAGQPLGVINAGATIGVARAATGTFGYADLVGMLEHFLPTARQGIWSVNQTGLSNLMTIQDPNGSYIWQPNVRDGVPQTVFGMPVFFNEKQPTVGNTGDVLLCDWSFYLIGDRQATTVDSTKFDQWRLDQTSWRAVHRVDGQPWLSAPITLQDGAATVSPFVQLTDKAT